MFLLPPLSLLQGTPVHGTPGSIAQKTPAFQWGIVIGADKTKQEAQDEINRAERALKRRASLYLCNGWYRTVVEYSSKSGAANALRQALRDPSLSKNKPYVVPLATWCPSKRLERE
jgi:hypothetical protein